jgi:hypothetical protein
MRRYAGRRRYRHGTAHWQHRDQDPGQRQARRRRHADRFFAQRDEKGRFEDLTKAGKSIARDRKTKAKTVVKKGYGNKGDLPVANPAKKKK